VKPVFLIDTDTASDDAVALIMALRAVGWDREAAARDLGISRATIYRKLKRHQIGPPPAHGIASGETLVREEAR